VNKHCRNSPTHRVAFLFQHLKAESVVIANNVGESVINVETSSLVDTTYKPFAGGNFFRESYKKGADGACVGCITLQSWI